MYFFKEKRFLLVFLVMVRFVPLFPQEIRVNADSNIIRIDTVSADTIIPGLKLISPDAIDKEVTYSAKGRKKNDLVRKTATLIGEAVVTYGDIEIKADSIVFNMDKNTVFATGKRDTTGKMAGAPVFKEGGNQEIESDSLFYNFITRKAKAYNIVTKQDEGLLHSAETKLLDDGTTNIARSTYSTCDAFPPHFYISLPKAKIYPGKKIVSGPGYLVLEGIPLPLALPFGFFPIQTKRAASGILIPKVGQEQSRGYNLTDGGYYFAISDNFDLALRGSIYTNGTWIANAETNYNKRYKYSGKLSFGYANNISGHKGLPDFNKVTNYKITWTYTQDAKAKPGSRFSANVNMSSSGYDKTNSYQVAEHVTTQRQSSVSYSRTWEGTPFNFSASMNHNQDVRTKKVNLNLPKISFNISRIYPFKGRNSAGTKKWYQELQLQYSASLDNQISTSDSLLFTNKVWNSMRNGFKHDIPVSLQIRPFKNFSISPQVTYSGVLYTQKYDKKWVTDYFDPELNQYVSRVITDTTRGAFYGQSINPSVSVGFNPQVFGTYSFKPDSRVQAIRHVMKPSVSFNYVPAIKELSSSLYRKVQYDTLGHQRDYSIFEGNIYGTPSLATRSSSISFNLTNIIEAKVFDRNDTTGKPKKVRLIDNLGLATSYNLFKDSIKWAPVSMVMRTTLFNNLGISANSSFSLYGLDNKGQTINTFLFAQNRKPMRLTNFGLSLDFDLGELIRGNKSKQTGSSPPQPSGALATSGTGSEGTQGGPGRGQTGAMWDEYGYAVFDVPWTMRVSYNFNYSKNAFTPIFTQTLSVSGNVTLTKKMAFTYTSGFDFKGKEITMTQIGFTRDLHCWDMSFNWIPNGTMKMWNFTIRVKAAVLSDLKYERRKDYHDENF